MGIFDKIGDAFDLIGGVGKLIYNDIIKTAIDTIIINPYQAVNSQVIQNVDNVLKDVSKEIGTYTADFLQERLHNMGLYNYFDKVWKTIGRPIINFQYNITKLRNKWLNKIPFFDNVMTIACLDPRVNLVFQSTITRDAILRALENGDIREALKIIPYQSARLLFKIAPYGKIAKKVKAKF